MLRAAGQVAEDVIVFAAYTPALEGAPVPRGVEIGNYCGAAGQDCAAAVLLQGVGGVFEAEPVAAGHVGAIDCEAHDIGRLPVDDGLFDRAMIEVTSPFGTDAAALHFAADRNGEADVHQQRLSPLEAVE